MFTSNYTSKKDLGIAFDQGVIINFDDVSLVDSLVEIRGRCPELVSFRLNPGVYLLHRLRHHMCLVHSMRH